MERNKQAIEILTSLSKEYRKLGKSWTGLFAPDTYYAMAVAIQEAKFRIQFLPNVYNPPNNLLDLELNEVIWQFCRLEDVYEKAKENE